MNTLSRAFWSGTIATSTMTVGLFEAWKRIPEREVEALPPGQLTESVAETVGTVPENAETRSNLSLIAHYGFGISTALIYAGAMQLLGNKRARVPVAASGAAFGSLVWITSYFGWIPAFGQRPSGFKLSSRQNFVMFACHLVWGITLASTEKHLSERGHQLLDGRRTRRVPGLN